ETSVRAAARLQPDAAETHLVQAIHFYWGYRNYDRARAELAKAQRTLPNNAQIFQFLGLIDRRQSRWDEAIRNLERAVDLDPRNQDMLNDLKDTYYNLRRYEEAIAVAYRALSLQPRNALLRTLPAWIGVDADANIAPLRATLNTIEAEGPVSATEVANISFQTALRERDPAAAARALANISNEGYMKEADYRVPHGWYEGLLAKLRQDAPAAHSAFMTARAETEKVVRAQPGNAQPLTALALIDPKNVFAELKRRNVYKVAMAYAVVAWLLMQVASQIFPFFEIPNWAVRLVVLLLVIGFPVAVILAWAFALTPEGIKRAEDVDVSKSLTRKSGRKLDFFIIAVLLLV